MLTDPLGRTFSYLRLSITPHCNFRCQYCLPNGNPFLPGSKSPITQSEIRRLIQAFARLGVEKVRVTGGEPAVRQDLVGILRDISATPGISKLALSTNAFQLSRDYQKYYEAGVRALNVSVDSLDEKKFFRLTGQNKLKGILEGVERCLALDGLKLKLNAVLMKGHNDNEIDNFIEYIRNRPISFRFIELMPTADNPLFFKKHHFNLGDLYQSLIERGWTLSQREKNAGPAEVFHHPGYQGSIGLIRPYSTNFCDHCNRLRVTSLGELRLCLFGEANYSLRSLLQSEDQQDQLQETIQALLLKKDPAHRLHEDRYEGTRNFASIGG